MKSFFGNGEYPEVAELFSLARAAGVVMTDNFNLDRNWTLKPDDTPVTPADITINNMVIRWFDTLYPDITVLAEEGNRVVAGAEYIALCDPIDGTNAYGLGIPVSAFCISILKGNKPFMSVIYDPFQQRLWHAETGKGAYLNGKAVHVSNYAQLAKANMAVVWWKNCGHHMHDVAGKLIDSGVNIQNVCSLVYFGGLIATGTMEASIFPGRGAWETAAMEVIVKEAGGTVTDLHGNDILYERNGYQLRNGSVVSNGFVHQQILDLIREVQTVRG